MPSNEFLAQHYSAHQEGSGLRLHFRGTNFGSDIPGSDDPGWESLKGGARRIRIHGPFLVQGPDGELECSDGWLHVDGKGRVSVEEDA